MSSVDGGPQDRDSSVAPLRLPPIAPAGQTGEWGPCYVTHRAGDHRHPMPARSQQSGKLIVPGSAWFVDGRKRLVDDKDMHSNNGSCRDWLAGLSTENDLVSRFTWNIPPSQPVPQANQMSQPVKPGRLRRQDTHSRVGAVHQGTSRPGCKFLRLGRLGRSR